MQTEQLRGVAASNLCNMQHGGKDAVASCLEVSLGACLNSSGNKQQQHFLYGNKEWQQPQQQQQPGAHY